MQKTTVIKMDTSNQHTIQRVSNPSALDDEQKRGLWAYAFKKMRAKWEQERIRQEWIEANPVDARPLPTGKEAIDYSRHINYNE
jgi:hypothetical protein